MNRWHPFQSHMKSMEKVRQGIGTPSLTMIGCIGVLLSGLWIGGCSSPPKPTPQPSTKEIRGDADRFFEKMEQEKQGKPEAQP